MLGSVEATLRVIDVDPVVFKSLLNPTQPASLDDASVEIVDRRTAALWIVVGAEEELVTARCAPCTEDLEHPPVLLGPKVRLHRIDAPKPRLGGDAIAGLTPDAVQPVAVGREIRATAAVLSQADMLHLRPRNHVLHRPEDQVGAHRPIDEVVFLEIENQWRPDLVERPDQALAPRQTTRGATLDLCALETHRFASPVLGFGVQQYPSVARGPIAREQLEERLPTVLEGIAGIHEDGEVGVRGHHSTLMLTENPCDFSSECRRASARSASTISAHISRTETTGSQPSFVLAFVGSPSRDSTSAGRK